MLLKGPGINFKELPKDIGCECTGAGTCNVAAILRGVFGCGQLGWGWRRRCSFWVSGFHGLKQ